MKCTSLLFGLLMLWYGGWAQEIAAPQPDTTLTPAIPKNNLPPSEIDVPITIALRSVYQFANDFVDTLYTSPNYPNDWVMDGCSVRYQYRFVRGPMQFKAVNNLLYVSFSGFYGLRGSTRVCSSIGNSPWTPACSCGLGSEAPRRIDAGFVMQLSLQPDYRFGVVVNSINPVPVDKCSVCFFGKDVTASVVDQLKAELALSIEGFRKQLEAFSLKPYLQMVWDSLQTPYPLPGLGFMQVQPSSMRISQLRLLRDSLFVSIGLSARPELKKVPDMLKKPMPPLTDFTRRGGFRLFIAQSFPYDSLSNVVNANLGGKEFAVGKGVFRKTVRIDSVKLQGGGKKLFLKVFVSKAAKGVFFMEGIPTWDTANQLLYFDKLDYHVQSRQVMLKSAQFLLDGVISQKLKEFTTISFSDKVLAATGSIAGQMNRNIYPGVSSRGYLQRFSLDRVEAAEDGLFIQGAMEGRLWLDVDAGQLLRNFLQ